jgi:hypothetical protein
MLTWDNTMLPQEQTFVCLERSQACPKSQFQNPLAQTTKRIGKLNLSPLIWLNHPCNYNAPTTLVLPQCLPCASSTHTKRHVIHLHPKEVNVLVEISNILPPHDKFPLINHLPQATSKLIISQLW